MRSLDNFKNNFEQIIVNSQIDHARLISKLLYKYKYFYTAFFHNIISMHSIKYGAWYIGIFINKISIN